MANVHTPTYPGRWERTKENVAYFFRSPTRLPLMILLALLVVLVPQVVSPVLKSNWRIALDLQDFRCLPYTAYVFRMGAVDERLPDGRRIDLKRGMLVSFISSDNAMGIPELDGQRITKIVAGLPGDILEVKGDVAYVNGKEWGKLSLLNTLQKAPGSFDRTAVVPPGQVLLLGSLETSYDGRYYGFMDQSAINAQAFALF